VQAAIGGVRKWLNSASGGAAPPALSVELKAALEALFSYASAAEDSAALQAAGLSELRDDALLSLLLCEAAPAGASLARSLAAAAALLLPALRRLEAPASRDLAAAVKHMCKLAAWVQPKC
jgi:hypothetical protein